MLGHATDVAPRIALGCGYALFSFGLPSIPPPSHLGGFPTIGTSIRGTHRGALQQDSPGTKANP